MTKSDGRGGAVQAEVDAEGCSRMSLRKPQNRDSQAKLIELVAHVL